MLVTKLLGRSVELRDATAELTGKVGTIEAAYLEQNPVGVQRLYLLVDVEGLLYSALYTLPRLVLGQQLHLGPKPVMFPGPKSVG